MPGTRPRADAFSASTGPPAALRDEVVLQVLGERGVARDLAEALGELAAALAELAAQAAELRRGRVAQVGSVLLDRAPDLLGDREERRVDAGHDVEQRGDVGPLRERAASRHARADRAPDLRQRARVERAAARRELGRLAHVGRATEVGLGRVVEQRDRLGRLLLAQPHDVRVRRRAERLGERGAGSLAVAPASRASTAGSSSSSRSCSRMERVYGRAGRCSPTAQSPTIPADALPGRAAAARREHVSSPTAAWRRRSIFLDGHRPAVLRDVPVARARGGPRGDEPLLRAVPRRRPGATAPASCSRPTRGVPTPPGARSSATRSTTSPRRTGDASRFVEEIRDREEEPGRPIVISAPFGPGGDAYDPESR